MTSRKTQKLQEQKSNISVDDNSSDEEITSEEFDKMFNKQRSYNIQKWTDLKIGKIYTITSFKRVNTIYGVGLILSLKNHGDVWAPSHLFTKIENKKPPFYVRPLGLRNCKNNKTNQYHAYDLVFP